MSTSDAPSHDQDPSRKRKPDEQSTDPSRSQRWHGQYPRSRGLEVTLESFDGCLFRVPSSLLGDSSEVFKEMFALVAEADTPIPIELVEDDLAHVLNMLRKPDTVERVLIELSNMSLGYIMTAVNKYELLALKELVEIQIQHRLIEIPVHMFRLASDLNDVQLARRALALMTAPKLRQRFPCVSDVLGFADTIRLGWQMPFLRLLFSGCGTTYCIMWRRGSSTGQYTALPSIQPSSTRSESFPGQYHSVIPGIPSP